MEKHGSLLLAVLLAVGLAGCGSESLTGRDPGTEAPRAAAEGTAALTGTVTADDGPVAGATVTLTAGESTLAELVTDGEGTFVADGLPAGACDIGVAGDGLETTSTGTVLGGGDTTVVTIELEASDPGRVAAGRIVGRVVKTNGEPIPGARVVAVKPGTEKATESLASGEYVLGDLPPGLYKVRCAKDGYLPAEVQEVPVRAGEARLLKFVLRLKLAPGRIVGAVRNAKGEPLPGARVAALSGHGEVSTFTGPRGLYELNGMAPGHYRLVASKEGYLPSVVERVPVRPNSTTEQNFVLRRQPGRLVGMVKSAAGVPLAGARVVAFNREVERAVVTGERGHYELELPPGEYAVRASKEGYQPSEVRGVRIEAGQRVEKHFLLRPSG